MLKLKYFLAAIVLLLVVSCDDDKYEVEVPPPVEVVPGSADFSNYVAVGNSLTAGISDGSLFIAAQDNTYPNLLAQKMALAGGGEFMQPTMDDNIGGLLVGGIPMPFPFSSRLILSESGIENHPGTPTTEVTNIKPGPYNNMGVAGARSYHLLANGYGNAAGLPAGLANPYFVRMASNANASVLEDAMAMNPSFFSLWIGSNDVLGYATSGGDGSIEITDQSLFAQAMQGLIGGMASTGAQGIVGNVPNVLHGAFFTAVPYNPLDPTNPDFGPLIPELNATFAQLNAAYAFLGVPERSIVFSETEASAIVIHDESLANISAQLTGVLMAGGLDPGMATILGNQYGQSRQANEGDLVLLTGSTVISNLNMEYLAQLVGMGVPQELAGQLSVYGITYPMPDNLVLVNSEVTDITEATSQFNATIQQVAGATGLTVFDAHGLMDNIAQNGYASDGLIVTTDFPFGGLFSLDGIHLTARGNAIVANELMKVIDATFGSNFEEAGELYDISEAQAFYPSFLP